MILVDTSVWVQHLRHSDPDLQHLLMEGQVLCHPFIIGEIACGYLKNRKEILTLLEALPCAKVAQPEELLKFIESRKLFGSGIGFVDIHLLASCFLNHTLLWTQDTKLAQASIALHVSYKP